MALYNNANAILVERWNEFAFFVECTEICQFKFLKLFLAVSKA